MSDYIFQFDEFQSLAKKADLTIKVGKYGFVFFADNETLGNQVLGFIDPKTQKIGIQVPINRKTILDLEEFEDTEEIIDFIKDVESNFKESKKSSRKSIKESSFSFVTVGDFCKHCATNYKDCEIWSVDGSTLYEKFDNLNKVNKSPYKYHEVMLWDVQNDTIVLYIENEALSF